MNTIYSFVNTHNFINKINALIFVFFVLSSCTINFAMNPIDLDTSFGAVNHGTDHTLLGEQNKAKNDSSVSSESNTQSTDTASLDFLLKLNEQTVNNLFKAYTNQSAPKKSYPLVLTPPQEPYHLQPSTDPKTPPHSNQSPDLSIDFTLSSFTQHEKLQEGILAAHKATLQSYYTSQQNTIAGSIKIKLAENNKTYSICICVIVAIGMGIIAKKCG